MSTADPNGPHVVAVGGGHGLAATLRAARRYAGRITAIVTVADDGGSSGRLREDLGVPALGDMRLCLSALAADPQSVWARTSEHRFEAGPLEGHAAGNLILLALTRTAGGLVPALAAAGELVGAVGDVLPATTESVVLKARVRDGAGRPETVEGQVAVATTAPVEEISLVPADVLAPPEAVAAIGAADQIVLGPGSLFTSVLAAAVVPAIREALAATGARKVHVANLREQAHETTGFTVADHVAALHRHGVPVDVVLHDPAALALGDLPGVLVVAAELARPDRPVHDPDLLAAALEALV
jgi:uncharacterized cofD-like protein